MIKLNPQTKLSAIIKANAESIDALAGIAKPLNKLKNPLLRRFMASRVTIAEAASIAGCTVQDFRRALEPLGFVFDDVTGAEKQGQEVLLQPVWFSALHPGNTDFFDVRQLIAAGDDPLKQIMQRYQALPEGHSLCIINTFVPYPLIAILGGKGSSHYIQSISADLHYSWFFKSATANKLDGVVSGHQIHMMDEHDFDLALASFPQEQIITLVVSAQPMPEPMECILEALASLEEGQVVYVFHKRVPLHLMEELEDAAFHIRICKYADEDIRLFINHATR